MLAAQRKQKIIDELEILGFLTISRTAQYLKISEATIRRDFEELSSIGLAQRVRGGISKLEPKTARDSFKDRQNILANEKERIGKAAAKLVNNGDTIILDGGTTTSRMAKFIAKKKDIRVITNSITVADYLSDYSGVEVIVTGGYLYRTSKVLLGSPAIQTLEKLNAVKTFVSAGGVTLEGIGHSNSLIVETEKIMISRGDKSILLVDHTKFYHSATINICQWTEFKTVITDKPVPKKFADFFDKHNIEVTIAK